MSEETESSLGSPDMVKRLRWALQKAEEREKRAQQLLTQTLSAEAELRHDLTILYSALREIRALAEGPWVSPSNKEDASSAPWWAEEIENIAQAALKACLTPVPPEQPPMHRSQSQARRLEVQKPE